MFPAWVWIHRPHSKFLISSYSQELTIRDSRKCRNLITSEWYRERWGFIYDIVDDQNTKKRFDNTKHGHRISTSIRGMGTGEGGNFTILDDPNNAKDGESKVTRNTTNEIVSSSWSSRVNDRKTDVKITIQQRLHAEDVSGYMMEGDKANKIVRLILPMEFEVKRRARTIILPSTNGKVWEDPRTKPEELLWPERLGPEEVQEIKDELRTAYRIAGQLQQRPVPAGGRIIMRDWFAMWKQIKPPKVHLVVQSWDTALEVRDREHGCYSACTTWGLFKDAEDLNNMILLSLWRGMVEYPDLRKMAIRLYNDYRDDDTLKITADGKHIPDMVLVEAKANGSSLVHDLSRAGIKAFRFDPGRYGDKEERVKLSSYMIEAGRVWVPGKPPDFTHYRNFGETLVQLCEIFPAADARDVVDTMSQAILRLRDDGYLKHPSDYVDDTPYRIDHSFYGADSSKESKR